MSNKVGEIIDDVVFRTGIENRVAILRAMNRVYTRLNRKYKAVTSSVDIESTDLDDDNSCAKPADLVEIYNIIPEYKYVKPDNWTEDFSQYYYTIRDGKFIFDSINEDDVVSVFYYSTGLVLVDAADGDVTAGQTNTPEWPEDLQQILLYATCLDISANYPLIANDVVALRDLEPKLGYQRFRVQSKTPEPTGENWESAPSRPDYR